jgi:hypothetical protein
MDCVERVCIEGGLIRMCVNQYARGCSDPSRYVQRRDRMRIWIRRMEYGLSLEDWIYSYYVEYEGGEC